MTRWKASGIHLLLSFVIVSGIAAAIYLLWFPYGLIRIAGMDRLLITMLCVDIVAGPLLTLIVFKAHDMRQTRRDLAVIGLLQAGFMAYALQTAWMSRPVFLVWSVDQMTLLYAHELEPEHLAEGKTPRMRSLSWLGPRLVAVSLPKGHDARAAIFIDLIKQQTSLERLPKHYADYARERSAVLRLSRKVTDRPLPARLEAETLASAIAAVDMPESRMRIVPLSSSRDTSYLLIDAKTAAPLYTLPPAPIEAGHSSGSETSNTP